MFQIIQLRILSIAMLIVIPFLVVQAQEVTTTDPALEDAAAAVTEPVATTTEEFTTPSATSSDAIGDAATSSPPRVDEPEPPKEEPFVLQPAVDLTIRDTALSAEITLENLTCKECSKTLPELEVVAYYTGWYPNDGEIGDIGPRAKVETSRMDGIANWGKRNMIWTATDVPKGRYYFVVIVDPENTHGAYRMHRSEFSI